MIYMENENNSKINQLTIEIVGDYQDNPNLKLSSDAYVLANGDKLILAYTRKDGEIITLSETPGRNFVTHFMHEGFIYHPYFGSKLNRSEAFLEVLRVFADRAQITFDQALELKRVVQ